MKFYLVSFRDEEAGEHPCMRSTVVAVVKQADRPATGKNLQKFQQCARSLREIEPVNAFTVSTGMKSYLYLGHDGVNYKSTKPVQLMTQAQTEQIRYVQDPVR